MRPDGSLTEQEERIATAMSDLWEQIGADLLAANAIGRKGRKRREMSRADVVDVMSDFFVSHWPHSGPGDFQSKMADANYFCDLPKAGRVRLAILERAFPSRYRWYGN